MSEAEFEHCCGVLGVDRAVTAETLKKIFLQKSYALIRQGAPETEREQLRAAHTALAAYLDAKEQIVQSQRRAEAKARKSEPTEAIAPQAHGPEAVMNPYDPFSFDGWLVNLIAP